MSKSESGLGGDQVEGRRPVLELLRGGRRVHSVSLSRAAERDAVVDEIVERAGPKLNLVPPDRVSALARTDGHQGVVATADPLRSADFDGLCAAGNALIVALDGVTDPRNLGAVMRAAETAGATGIVLPRHRSARVTPAVTKAAAGAIEYLPIASVSSVPAALERAGKAGLWSVGLDERGDRSIFELDLADQPIVLVLGAEGRGLARLTRERCDVLVSIPMRGHVASLNVASAAALACHEIARRRAG